MIERAKLRRLRRPIALLLVLAASAPAWGAAPLALGSLPRIEFQPAKGERLQIPLLLTTPGSVQIELLTGDGDRVRTLASDGALQPGPHVLDWDGKDDAGTVVPDEAYHIVLRCDCGSADGVVVDSRQTSGGESLGSIRPLLSPDGAMSFDLREPARVLVRIGAKGGAMMRTLEGWRPHAAGRTRLSWDGMDASGVEPLLGSEGISVMVAAFALPHGTVISTGNGESSYAQYRLQRGWSQPEAQFDEIRLERNGARLMRQSQLPISQLRDPHATLQVIERLPQREDGTPVVTGPITFRIDVAPEDRWVLDQSLYEVSFFLDRQFVSEEETGYTPLSWRWDPRDVAPGLHTMTVNVSGFVGHVGVASVRLWVAEPTPKTATRP